MASKKLFVIIGITGNQGGSVARTFLSDPNLKDHYRLRGISRDPSSEASKHLTSQGVEIIQANLHDPTSLAKAFEGANVIFSVTDFWALYFNPSNHVRATKESKPIGQIAYELEYEQGRNIVDAAAKVPDLERFVVSMLSSPKKWTKGKYKELWHYESKADMITYMHKTYPDLAAKYSGLNMGVFFYSWKSSPSSVRASNPTEPTSSHYPVTDTGPFVRALLEVQPGVQLYGETCLKGWREWLEVWGRVLGREVRYERVDLEWYERELRGRGLPEGFGREIAEMFEFMDEYGYDGGDPDCKRKEELGIPIPDLSNVEEYIKTEDWSPLSQ